MTYTRDVGLFVSKRGERYHNSSERIFRKGPTRAGRRPWDLIDAAHRGFELTPEALQEAVLGGLEVGRGSLWGACTIPVGCINNSSGEWLRCVGKFRWPRGK